MCHALVFVRGADIQTASAVYNLSTDINSNQTKHLEGPDAKAGARARARARGRPVITEAVKELPAKNVAGKIGTTRKPKVFEQVQIKNFELRSAGQT